MTRIAYVLGTRPEVIRSARVLQLMTSDEDIDLAIINTGQHYDANMLADFLAELRVPPVSIDLAVGSADPVGQVTTVMMRTAEALARVRPACVCVFGDTNSSLGAGLAGVKAGVPVVHIEAGCRSFDMRMPEEVNRRVLDHLSTLLLAVSELGSQHLRAEDVLGHVEVVGDPQYDVFARQQLPRRQANDAPTGLITLHRPENVDLPHRLSAILTEIAAASPATHWVFPVHPRTRRTLGRDAPAHITLLDPLPYRELLELLFASSACITDSGGLQKEAFWARVPCVTVRESSEWMETVWQGANTLAQPGHGLSEAVAEALTTELPATFENPYGDGNASARIVEAIATWAARRAESTTFAASARRGARSRSFELEPRREAPW